MSFVGGTLNTEIDRVTVNLPQPPAGDTYVTTITGAGGGIRDPWSPPVNTNINPNNGGPIINGTTVQITVQQTTGTGGVRNNVTGTTVPVNFSRVESRIKIKTVKRVRVRKWRYRFLGIPLPFFRRLE
jgi:hypothetical protein